VPAKRDIISYIRIPKKNPNAITRKIFTHEEIASLWDASGEQMKRIALLLIFTGLRVSELLELKDEEVDLAAQKISVTHAKTPSGIREVPIGDKLLPLMEKFMAESHPPYEHVRRAFQTFGHTPHDTRHTFASMAAEAQIDQRLIDAMLGHSGGNTALKIYTHFSLEAKLEAVNNLLEIC
jgi:integrase